jgi:hypothetical protein
VPETIASKVDDSISKLNGEIAVEDLGFQRKWWKFERVVWILFAIALLADIAGAFGRGPLAKTERQAPDHSFTLRYERIQRTGTPSILTANFNRAMIHDSKVTFYVQNSLVRELGSQRVIPSPQTVIVGNDGLTYTFPASMGTVSISFALEPTGPGLRHLTLQVAGSAPLKISILVLP